MSLVRADRAAARQTCQVAAESCPPRVDRAGCRSVQVVRQAPMPDLPAAPWLPAVGHWSRLVARAERCPMQVVRAASMPMSLAALRLAAEARWARAVRRQAAEGAVESLLRQVAPVERTQAPVGRVGQSIVPVGPAVPPLERVVQVEQSRVVDLARAASARAAPARAE